MRRPAVSAAVADVAAVLGGLTGLGAVCGLVWWWAVDPADYVRRRGGGGAMSEVDQAHLFDADGWYAVLALLVGFGAGVALSWWRSRDPWLTTLLLAPGAGLAALAMVGVGHLLGGAPSGPALAAARVGEEVPVALAVSAESAYLMWPIGVLLGALMVLWSAPGVPGVGSEDKLSNREQPTA